MAEVLHLLFDLGEVGVELAQLVGPDVDLVENLIAPELDLRELRVESGAQLARLAQQLVGRVVRGLTVPEQVRGADRLELVQRSQDRPEQLLLALLAGQLGVDAGELLLEFVEGAADPLDAEGLLFQ